VAYACSFRVTEAVYLVERMVDCLADELGADPAELRMKNLLRPEQFPYQNKTGWEYDSGDYPTCRARRWTWPGTRRCAGSRPSSGPGAS
jgi:carbon-monoxide dehydrogenase large subunit